MARAGGAQRSAVPSPRRSVLMRTAVLYAALLGSISADCNAYTIVAQAPYYPAGEALRLDLPYCELSAAQRVIPELAQALNAPKVKRSSSNSPCGTCFRSSSS